MNLDKYITELLSESKLSLEERLVLRTLRLKKGSANAMKRIDIASGLGISERALRKTVKNLIEKHGVPIASSQTGHYLITTEREKQSAKADLLSRSRSLMHRAMVLDSIQLGA